MLSRKIRQLAGLPSFGWQTRSCGGRYPSPPLRSAPLSTTERALLATARLWPACVLDVALGQSLHRARGQSGRERLAGRLSSADRGQHGERGQQAVDVLVDSAEPDA